uniref:cell division protein FtsQ/DivIB n=1 Tax=Sulfurihydrogenibium sp. TaxID=2053621 RepID=UPI00262977D8
MIKKLTLVVLWLSICAVVGYLAPTLPLVKDIISIKTVNVKGTDKFKEEDIKEIFKTQNWFFLTESYVNEKLKSYPFVKKVVVYKPQIGQVDLLVEERKPFAIVNHDNKHYVVDKDGEILNEKLIDSHQNLLKVNLSGKF